MKRPVHFTLLTFALALSFAGCRSTPEVLPREIYVHTESQLSNAFLPWSPANLRSFAGTYSGEMGDTAESARINVIEGKKKVMIEGLFVTRTAGRAPSEKPFEAAPLNEDPPPSFRAAGQQVLFVTYMDPLQTVYKRPVNGLVHNGLFYVKDSELE